MVKNYKFNCFKTVNIILMVFVLVISSAFGAKDLEISKDFTLFTSKNMQGYLKPFFTSIEESFNTNIFTKAQYDEYWNIAFDISINGMFIPDGQKSYDAELPDMYGTTMVDNAVLYGGDTLRQVGGHFKQPTIYGGHSYAIFSSPQNHKYPDTLYKSVAFVEGNNLSFAAGVPVLQLIGGFPTRTQLRLRFWGAPVQDEFLSYFGVMVNQQVDHFFNLFGTDTSLGLALNFAFHNVNRTNGLSINSFAIGSHFSKTWDNGFSAFASLQYENMSGTFEAVRIKTEHPEDVINSPYLEVRNQENLKFDIETFNKFRILGGISYRTGIFEFHGDAAWAQQPILSLGVTFWFASWGQKTRESEKIEKFEEIERIEKIKKKETIEKKEFNN
jgi:hypothetical protein